MIDCSRCRKCGGLISGNNPTDLCICKNKQIDERDEARNLARKYYYAYIDLQNNSNIGVCKWDMVLIDTIGKADIIYSAECGGKFSSHQDAIHNVFKWCPNCRRRIEILG